MYNLIYVAVSSPKLCNNLNYVELILLQQDCCIIDQPLKFTEVI